MSDINHSRGSIIGKRGTTYVNGQKCDAEATENLYEYLAENMAKIAEDLQNVQNDMEQISTKNTTMPDTWNSIAEEMRNFVDAAKVKSPKKK